MQKRNKLIISVKYRRIYNEIKRWIIYEIHGEEKRYRILYEYILTMIDTKIIFIKDIDRHQYLMLKWYEIEGIQSMNKERAAGIFKSLSDPNRLKIVKLLLNNEEICACKLLGAVDCKQATLSHHLSVLTAVGLLEYRRDGKNVIYSCNRRLIKEVIDFMSESCEECGKLEDNSANGNGLACAAK